MVYRIFQGSLWVGNRIMNGEKYLENCLMCGDNRELRVIHLGRNNLVHICRKCEDSYPVELCDFCGKNVASESTFYHNIRSCLVCLKDLIKCDICGYYLLKQHTRKNSMDKNICPVCYNKYER